ncbi:MAG: hypothetical protein ACO4AJ_00920 [Prochlorothrix sp.]|nr:hypothetical protein [Prochlorothrix sp.]
MKTPSHAVINLALLMPHSAATAAIALGSVLPDVPIFVMYVWAKGVRRQDDRKIWSEIYYSSFWYGWTALVHSIPLALGIAALGSLGLGDWAIALGLSMALHDLLDLPVHHDDAHCHFLPFSAYRFISPFSYWDPRHYGRQVAWVEALLVLGATVGVWPWLTSVGVRGVLLLVNALYWIGPSYAALARLWVGCPVPESNPVEQE